MAREFQKRLFFRLKFRLIAFLIPNHPRTAILLVSDFDGHSVLLGA